MTGKRQVEARWGVKFWDLVTDFAEQGLNRSDTARALGYRVDSFSKLLAANPGHDPFEAFIVAQAYLKDTGETMRQALERLAAEGKTWGDAANVIGYSDGSRLKRAAASRGLTVQLRTIVGRPRRPEKRKKVDQGPNVTTGWPTWEKVYEMTSPSNHPRKKKSGSV